MQTNEDHTRKVPTSTKNCSADAIGALIAADHKNLNIENESGVRHRNAVVQDSFSYWIKRSPIESNLFENNTAAATLTCLQRFVLPSTAHAEIHDVHQSLSRTSADS